MCLYSVQVRGITVCGRRVYRTDTGVKIGFQGPTVSLDEACNDLNASKAEYLRTSCIEIDRKMTERQQANLGEIFDNEPSPDVLFQRTPNSTWLTSEADDARVTAEIINDLQTEDVQDMRDFENN